MAGRIHHLTATADAGRRAFERYGYQLVRPNQEQVAEFTRAHRWAERLLGKLPQFPLFWYAEQSLWGLPRGITLCPPDPLAVGLNVQLRGEQVFSTSLHELRHVHDICRHPHFSVDERETKAEEFTKTDQTVETPPGA
jgi:hypothetical protein